jgi:mono/diheme cytochrome c family protein
LDAVRTVVWLLVAMRVAGCGEQKTSGGASTAPRSSPPGPRMTMDALHKLGGVPAGWQLTPPPGDVEAGRKEFVDLGCHSCHKVAGEPFSNDAGQGGVGPELTGMGSHHPPGYFAEAIINPDAVLVEGDGWIGADGRSVMPAYPDLTVAQLADLVAYIGSLTMGGEHAGHDMSKMGGPAPLPFNLAQKPTPPPMEAKSFFVQAYDVLPGKVADFETWFAGEGREKFLQVDGLVSVDTFVDTTKPGPAVTSVFGFRDDAALNAFMTTHDPAAMSLGAKFDSFIGDHDHTVFRLPPVYRVPGLSTLQTSR